MQFLTDKRLFHDGEESSDVDTLCSTIESSVFGAAWTLKLDYSTRHHVASIGIQYFTNHDRGIDFLRSFIIFNIYKSNIHIFVFIYKQLSQIKCAELLPTTSVLKRNHIVDQSAQSDGLASGTELPSYGLVETRRSVVSALTMVQKAESVLNMLKAFS